MIRDKAIFLKGPVSMNMPKIEPKNESLLLASASPIRKKMLEQAGVQVSVFPADINEGQLRDKMAADRVGQEEMTTMLACEKAHSVSPAHPRVWVLGCDQTLLFDGALFSKPCSWEQAKENLKRMRGKTHRLISAVVICKDRRIIWACQGVVDMHMRDFSDMFLADYMQKASEDLCATVGSYCFEGHGAQLFDGYDGDYFSILGLPLIEVLGFLRQQRVLLT